MRLWMLIVIGLCSSGCLMEVVTVTAIQGELAAQNATSANRVRAQAKDMKSKIELESAINMYSGTTGGYPVTLDLLVPVYLPEVPVQSNGVSFLYDARTGKVALTRVGGGGAGGSGRIQMTAGDTQNLGNLRKAVHNYWQMTGYYPESLASLAPLYINSIPTMSSGGAFPYDRGTGTVALPGEFRTSPQPGRPVSHQTPGGQVGSISGDHNQRQMRALDELGF